MLYSYNKYLLFMLYSYNKYLLFMLYSYNKYLLFMLYSDNKYSPALSSSHRLSADSCPTACLQRLRPREGQVQHQSTMTYFKSPVTRWTNVLRSRLLKVNLKSPFVIFIRTDILSAIILSLDPSRLLRGLSMSC